jgi:PurA ssDNA and RNA-binding protein
MCYSTIVVCIFEQRRISINKAQQVMVTCKLIVFQVRTNFRTAITIPERSWVRFRDILSEFVDKQPLGPSAGGSGGDGGGGPVNSGGDATMMASNASGGN